MDYPTRHDPAIEAGAKDAGRGASKTLFDWHRRNRSLRLPIYLLVSIALLSLFFYLFQVSYPTPERTLPRSQEITLLSPTDPLARGLLDSINDRAVALALPLAPAQEAFDWSGISVRLRPSFDDHRFRPAGIVEMADQAALPDLLAPGSLRRPAVNLPELPPAPQPGGLGVVVWQLQTAGGLAGWEVLEAPALQPPRTLLLELPAIEFTAAVDREGRVRHLMPLGQGDPELQQQVWRHSHDIRLAPPDHLKNEVPTANAAHEAGEPERARDLIWGILRWQPADF